MRPRTSGSVNNGGGAGAPSASAGGGNRGMRALPPTTTASGNAGGSGGSVSVGSRIIVVGTARSDVNGLSGIATGFDQQSGGGSSDGRCGRVCASEFALIPE